MYEDGACASWDAGNLVIVSRDTIARCGSLELCPESIARTNRTNVGTEACLPRYPLCNANGVLRCAPGDVLHGVRRNEFVIEWEVGRFGKNCIVELECILVEQGLGNNRANWSDKVHEKKRWYSAARRDSRMELTIKERVTHAQEVVCRGRHLNRGECK